MIQRKSKPKTTKKKKPMSQEDLVLNYLEKRGKKGATNFEMMMALRICDVRKAISRINSWNLAPVTVESEFETGATGKTYKRYWAVPIDKSLQEFLSESKHTGKIKKKRTGGGKR